MRASAGTEVTGLEIRGKERDLDGFSTQTQKLSWVVPQNLESQEAFGFCVGLIFLTVSAGPGTV